MFQYKPNDNIFDIESLEDIFIDTHYFPVCKRIDIYYLSDIPNYEDLSSSKLYKSIKKRIFECNYSLRKIKNRLKVNFYNLARPIYLAKYCSFWGITPTRNSAINYMNEHGSIHTFSNYAIKKHYRYPKWTNPNKYDRYLFNHKDYTSHAALNMAFPYYTVKQTDPLYKANPDKYGLTIGFNSTNYDLTMISIFLGHVVYNDYARNYLNEMYNPHNHLSKQYWTLSQENSGGNIIITQQERDDFIHHVLNPHFLRHYNDLLFSKPYKFNMPKLLRHQPDMQSMEEAGSDNFYEQIDNPAHWIYKGWLTSKRYLDISNLNEHMRFMPLKRIAATQGWQIMESPFITANVSVIKNFKQLRDLISYNNSDVQITKKVFELPEYQDSLDLRQRLLKKYPQLTYTFDPSKALKHYQTKVIKYLKQDNKISAKKRNQLIKYVLSRSFHGDMYKRIKNVATAKDVWISPSHLRFSPLTYEASSAKLISTVIAPYHSMKDWPKIEYVFPDSRALATYRHHHPNDKLALKKPINVLDDTMAWTKKVDAKYDLLDEPPADLQHFASPKHSLSKTFRPIYKLYKEIEGHNVDSVLNKNSQLFDINGNKRSIGPSVDISKLLHKVNTNIPYLHRDGSSTRTLASFSYGGIHGAEYNYKKYRKDYKKYLVGKHAIKYFKKMDLHPRKAKAIGTLQYEGYNFKTRELIKGVRRNAKWRRLEPPRLFKHYKRIGYILNKKYSYVSVNSSCHEDFSSYYPSLLTRMGIMWDRNENVDTYYHIYIERLRLKSQLNNYTKNSHKWNEINQKQNLRKLLLNSASGAADAHFYNTIRMNNKIASMRIIGQILTWRMSQAECLASNHAKITSTNTDGTYASGIPQKVNNKVLQKTVKPFTLNIKPVWLHRFVSRDANNRLEVETKKVKGHQRPVLAEARGNTLNAWQGPSVTSALDHPAIVDYVLAHYLAYQPDPCNKPLNMKVIKKLMDNKLDGLLDSDSKVRSRNLRFFQWIIVSNPGKHRYPFILPEVKRADEWERKGHATAISHTNRFFLTTNYDKKPNKFLRLATKKKINQRTYYHNRMHHKHKAKTNPIVKHIFNACNDHFFAEQSKKDLSANVHYFGRISRVPGFPYYQNVMVENHALNELSLKQVQVIKSRLDYRAYLKLIVQAYHKNWDNNY